MIITTITNLWRNIIEYLAAILMETTAVSVSYQSSSQDILFRSALLQECAEESSLSQPQQNVIRHWQSVGLCIKEEEEERIIFGLRLHHVCIYMYMYLPGRVCS